jgi:hypothetical protein
MRAPYLRQIAQPLAGAAPPLRSSRRWPLRADETRLPATASPVQPARPTPIAPDPAPAPSPAPSPASQAAREVFDPRPSAATAMRRLGRSIERAPLVSQAGQAAPAPAPGNTRSIAHPGPQQVESPQTVPADARLRHTDPDPGVVTTPERAAQRSTIAVSGVVPEASVEPRPEIARSEVSDRRSVRLPPGASADEPPGAPALPTGTETTGSTGQSPAAVVSGVRGPDRDRAQDDAGRPSSLPARRSFNEPTGQPAPAPEPSLRIGTVEVRVVPPPALAAPPQGRTANPSGTLSRGFVSPFGLRQG